MFEREYLGQWPSQSVRCEVATRHEQCPNIAVFVLAWREKTGNVCGSCVGSWLHELTRSGQPVVVERIP